MASNRKRWSDPACQIGDLSSYDCHLMVKCMECWALADRKTVKSCCGNGFRKSALPTESAGKAEALEGPEKRSAVAARKATIARGNVLTDSWQKSIRSRSSLRVLGRRVSSRPSSIKCANDRTVSGRDQRATAILPSGKEPATGARRRRHGDADFRKFEKKRVGNIQCLGLPAKPRTGSFPRQPSSRSRVGVT